MNIDEALEYAQNALERAFEDWLETERPSGDCESVHRQWDNSYARLELVDELQPVMSLTAEVRRLREQWQYYQDFCKQNGFDGITSMAVAVDKLREEVAMLTEQRNDHIKGSAEATTQCIEYQHLMAELREENERLRATQPQQSPWQPIATPIENGRRVIVASSNRMALFHGQFREYPFPRVVANDGSYITEFYAWMYEPELPPLPEPAP